LDRGLIFNVAYTSFDASMYSLQWLEKGFTMALSYKLYTKQPLKKNKKN